MSGLQERSEEVITYENMSLPAVRFSIDCGLYQATFQEKIRKTTETAIDHYYSGRKNRKDLGTMYLYDVIVWDQNKNELRARKFVASKNQENAQFAVLREYLADDEEPDDLDVFVGVVGKLKDRD